jgi:hypothetical protein
MHVRCLDPSSKKVLTGLTRSAATPRMSTAASIASTTFQRISTGASRPFTGATDSVRPYTGGTSTRPPTGFFSSRPQTGAAANVWARPTTRGNDPSMVLPPPSTSGALTARPHTRGTVNFSTPGPSGGGSLTARPSTKGHADGARPYSRGDAMFTPRPGEFPALVPTLFECLCFILPSRHIRGHGTPTIPCLSLPAPAASFLPGATDPPIFHPDRIEST